MPSVSRTGGDPKASRLKPISLAAIFFTLPRLAAVLNDVYREAARWASR